VKDFYNENYKSLMKKVKDIRRWKAHGLAELISLKWLYYQKQFIWSVQSHQNSNDIIHRNRKINPKVYMEAQKTLNTQGNTEQKEQCLR
jgi:hypothetical protein